MPRLTRDSRLESREARTKLKPRTSAYWRQIHVGLAIGYRRGKKSGTWVARKLIGDDKYEFKSLGIADDVAEANGQNVLSYQQAHIAALEFANVKTIRSNYTVREAAADYMKYVRAETKSVSQTEATINAFILPTFGDRRVDSLETTELDNWKNDLVTSPIRRRGKLHPVTDDPEVIRKRKASANRIWTVFKALLNRAWEKGKVSDDSAWRRVNSFEGVNESRKTFLNTEQCKRAINIAQGAFRNYVQSLLFTGCRPGKELEFIRVRDFDPAGTVRIQDSKTGARDVFLTDEGVRFFSRLTAGRDSDEILLLKDDGSQWGKNHHRKPMESLVLDAKLPADTVAYTFRHTYISFALLGGTNIKVVADQCGTSIKMIEEHYAKFLNTDRRKMFNAAMPSLGYEGDNVRAIA